MFEDPEYIRWKRKHPKFPGVARCVELLRRANLQGARWEIVFGELLANAPDHAAELVAAFRSEQDERVRRSLLDLLCQAKLREALPLFVDQLRSEDETLRYWSVEGLRALDTPEARKALWEAGIAKHSKR